MTKSKDSEVSQSAVFKGEPIVDDRPIHQRTDGSINRGVTRYNETLKDDTVINFDISNVSRHEAAKAVEDADN